MGIETCSLAGKLGFGLDYYRENGKSQDAWDEDRHNTGLFASYDHYFDKLHLQLGGRLDDFMMRAADFVVALPFLLFMILHSFRNK